MAADPTAGLCDYCGHSTTHYDHTACTPEAEAARDTDHGDPGPDLPEQVAGWTVPDATNEENERMSQPKTWKNLAGQTFVEADKSGRMVPLNTPASHTAAPMTAPDVTPAVQRAADAFTEAYQRAVREAPSNRQGQGVTREDGRKCYQAGMHAGLAAALDVEEMARAEHEYGCVFGGCTSTLDQHGQNVQKAYRSRAEFIRAAILGGAA